MSNNDNRPKPHGNLKNTNARLLRMPLDKKLDARVTRLERYNVQLAAGRGHGSAFIREAVNDAILAHLSDDPKAARCMGCGVAYFPHKVPGDRLCLLCFGDVQTNAELDRI